MKIRDSGMPPEQIWNSFFDVDLILSELEVSKDIEVLVEIGSGYGTFSLAVARIIKGEVWAFDIEKEMIDHLKNKACNAKISNIVLCHRDVINQSTAMAGGRADYIMLFNILHHHTPQQLLTEVYRVLKPGGKVGIIHWRSDITTPRGPDYSIRPKPEQIVQELDRKMFRIIKKPFTLNPYHFGILAKKTAHA